jgi:hypothetical protein
MDVFQAIPWVNLLASHLMVAVLWTISSESLIKNFLFFKVNKLLGELSDHCQISKMLLSISFF